MFRNFLFDIYNSIWHPEKGALAGFGDSDFYQNDGIEVLLHFIERQITLSRSDPAYENVI
jgi:hypothetical protein